MSTQESNQMSVTIPTTVNEDDDRPEEAIELTRLGTRTIEVPIRGVTPLIVHRFDEKARQMMLDAQMQKTKVRKAAKDPESDYNRSRYIIDAERDGFPAAGFKQAMVTAVSHFDNLTKVLAKQSVFVYGVGPEQLVPIVGQRSMREDTVRVGMGTADIRFRAQYTDWSAVLTIRYVTSSLTANSILALIDAAGLGGVGEWRASAPKSSSGSYGMFEVAQ
jgi:hypothetical protein